VYGFQVSVAHGTLYHYYDVCDVPANMERDDTEWQVVRGRGVIGNRHSTDVEPPPPLPLPPPPPSGLGVCCTQPTLNFILRFLLLQCVIGNKPPTDVESESPPPPVGLFRTST